MEFIPAVKTSDGQFFQSIAEAQEHEIASIVLEELPQHDVDPAAADLAKAIAKALLQKAPLILDILTTNKRSRPKTRAINGATRKRRGATAPVTGTGGVAAAIHQAAKSDDF